MRPWAATVILVILCVILAVGLLVRKPPPCSHVEEIAAIKTEIATIQMPECTHAEEVAAIQTLLKEHAEIIKDVVRLTDLNNSLIKTVDSHLRVVSGTTERMLEREARRR